jgi:hypothetical protein
VWKVDGRLGDAVTAVGVWAGPASTVTFETSLSGNRIGRRVRIKRADFDRLVEQGSGPGAPRESPNIWAGDLPEPDLPDT